MLEDIKVLLGITDDKRDRLINVLIKSVTQELKSLTNAKEIPENLIIDMVIVRYDRRGSETLSTASYNGQTENYVSIYPSYIQNQITDLKNKNRRLRTL